MLRQNLVHTLLFLVTLFFVKDLKAQTLFWNEDFGTGCNKGQATYTGINGAWMLSGPGGTSGSDQFFVSATEAGMGAGNCGNSCLTSSLNINRTLHVGVSMDPAAPSCTLGDCGAFYCNTKFANIDAESPVINCSGKYSITLTFDYILGGEAAQDHAYLEVYMPGAGPLAFWNPTVILPKTTCSNSSCTGTVPCSSSVKGTWASYTLNLPANADNFFNFRIRFKWMNDADGIGTDPSFAVDNIKLYAALITSTDILEAREERLNIFPNPSANELLISGRKIHAITVSDISGKVLLNFNDLTTDVHTVDISRLPAGLYFVTTKNNDSTVTRKFIKQ